MNDPLDHIRAEYEYYATQDYGTRDLWDEGFVRGLVHAYEVGRNGGPKPRPGYPFWTLKMEGGRAKAYAPRQAPSDARSDGA